MQNLMASVLLLCVLLVTPTGILSHIASRNLVSTISQPRHIQFWGQETPLHHRLGNRDSKDPQHISVQAQTPIINRDRGATHDHVQCYTGSWLMGSQAVTP